MKEPYRKGSSESILTSSLAGDTGGRSVKVVPTATWMVRRLVASEKSVWPLVRSTYHAQERAESSGLAAALPATSVNFIASVYRTAPTCRFHHGYSALVSDL
jgi:hypothetical protein